MPADSTQTYDHNLTDEQKRALQTVFQLHKVDPTKLPFFVLENPRVINLNGQYNLTQLRTLVIAMSVLESVGKVEPSNPMQKSSV